MSAANAIRCQNCGGTIAAKPGLPLPRCLFCASDAVVPFDPEESAEQPEHAIGFAVDQQGAYARFEDFAGSSWWYPDDLRNADIELSRLLVPAWAWDGRVETHWTALIYGATKSGKQPLAGVETALFEQILIPASKSLTVGEMRSLGHYDEEGLTPFDPHIADEPYEVAVVTRSAAKQKAVDEMQIRHRAALKQRHEAYKVHTSCIALSLEGDPVLVPVWIGAYPYGDKVYRVLVNGQTGRLVGEAPISWFKVAAVVFGVLAVLLFLLGLFQLLASLG